MTDDDASDIFSQLTKIGGFRGRHWPTSPTLYGGSPQSANTGGGALTSSAQFQAAYAAVRAQHAAYQAAQQRTSAYGIAMGFGHQIQVAQFGSSILLSGLAGMAREPEPEPEIENTGIEVGETIGWRCWRLADEGLLGSMAAQDLWLPDEPMKADKVQATYGTGVHAFKEFGQAWREYRYCGSQLIFGRVALWGEMVEFSKGYKGQFGRPFSFDVASPRLSNREMNDLRALYGLEPKRYGQIDEGMPATWRERLVSLVARMLRA